MLSPELLKRIRAIEFSTRKWVDELMSGQFKSQFKGHGLQFSEHRQYVPGDDVRHIDWKASARTRDPLIKKYEEERELVVLLLVDVSGSKDFGSRQRLKSEVAAEISGMLAYAAIRTGEKVGVIFFTDKIEKIIPPRKGRNHILRIIRDVLTFRPSSKGTDLSIALDAAGRVLKHSGIVFLLSDFMNGVDRRSGEGTARRSQAALEANPAIAQGGLPLDEAGDYSKSLGRLARRHELIGIQLTDPCEELLGIDAWVRFSDLEENDSEIGDYFVNTGSNAFKEWWKERSERFEANLLQTFKVRRVDRLRISTEGDHGAAVAKFFRGRRKRNGGSSGRSRSS